MSPATTQEWQHDLTTSERELLREVALALRGLRYGSVVLTVHDGRIVEVNKRNGFERVRHSRTRTARPPQPEGSRNDPSNRPVL